MDMACINFNTGDTYAGGWCNSQVTVLECIAVVMGAIILGKFSGVKHGIGCYHFKNGDRYAGEYVGDKIHDFGIYHFDNGHYYDGSWHEGRKQDYNMYSFRNDEARCGEWNNGNLKTCLPPLTDAILRAVQDNGERFSGFLIVISAYVEGFSTNSDEGCNDGQSWGCGL